MKEILQKLYNDQQLSHEEAIDAMLKMTSGSIPDIQIAAFLSALNMRPFNAVEIGGFREALLQQCRPVDFGRNTIDLCGTGGDGKDTFNISTLSSFVTAGAGVKVTKHGNYAVSSSCGSSNVLEFLGAKFTNDESVLKKQLEESNICFLHAPLFHSAMRHVSNVRKTMGVKSVFNILGPLVNPARPAYQVSGVFSASLLPLYASVFKASSSNFAVVYALDGYDEISLTGDFELYTKEGNSTLSPSQIGLQQLSQESISGGKTVAESAKIFTDILENNGSQQQNQVVIANAGLAIKTALGIDYSEGIAKARKSLESGKAFSSLQNFLKYQL